MNRERIETFIKVLRDPKGYVPNLIAFDMDMWGHETTLDNYADYDVGKVFTEDRHKCGTVCCAMGLAGLTPEFNIEGLSYDQKSGAFGTPGQRQQVDGFDAAAEFFGIDRDLASDIFHNNIYWYDRVLDRGEATGENLRPEDVADMLQLLLDGKLD